MSFTGRGIFDGENPPYTTTIFDDSIFDVEIVEPVPANELIVFVPGHTDIINTFWHGNETIPRRIQ